jgi:anti-sigma28 factor (negative regulator of flagellin synthesis)
LTKPNATKRKSRKKPAKKKKARKKPAKRKPAKKRKMGRPTKYTPARVKAILRAITNGNYKATAAQSVGISRDTLNEWEHRYPEFSDAIKKAEAKGEIYHVGRIRRGQEQWQSSAWFLERKYPDRWGKRERRDTGETGDVERYVPLPDGTFKRIAEGESQIGQFNESMDPPKA